MTYNENKKNYNVKYKQEHFKRVPLEVQKAKYEEIKAAAEKNSESINGYIKKAVDMRLESEAENRD